MSVVQIGELAISRDGDGELVAVGLGSCVALLLLGATDERRRICGLAHVLLPDGARTDGAGPAKYADRAVPALVDAMLRQGARRPTLRAAIIGGASMFAFSSSAGRDIGERNAVALEGALHAARIPLLARDVGGGSGRSVRVEPGGGRVLVRLARGVERELARARGTTWEAMKVDS